MRKNTTSSEPPPKSVEVDDTLTADAAYGLACQGTALHWRGDFQNARQLLTAMGKRAEGKPRKPKDPAEAFNLERQARAQRARTLNRLMVPLEADYTIPLRRAPDVREACLEAYGVPSPLGEGQGGGHVRYVPLRELLGLIGAHEWRRRGIELPAIGGRIHPHYGVFAPVRNEYVDLVARAALPEGKRELAFDVGTGTGVLAILLARRGFKRVVATDTDARALACARENVKRLRAPQVEVVEANLFPEGRAELVTCNPPWVPARPSSPLEHGIYDHESGMLKGFLQGLPDHLLPEGEGWLVLSDLAEHLGLRSRDDLLAWIASAGLRVAGREDIRPKHPKVSDTSDPLHAARKAEVTSLWRLRAA